MRAIVPGHVGVRNVKWLSAVVTSDEEAPGPWQRGIAYKGFAPGVRALDGVDVERVPSVQEQPVMSAITAPRPGETVEGESVTVRGFAWSGGGRGIVRVDVSADEGASWHTAELKEGSEQKLSRAWAWTFWEAEVPVPPGAAAAVAGDAPGGAGGGEGGGAARAPQRLTIVAKATDASYNTQPERAETIWNLRGINFNAWPRVAVELEP